MLSRSIRFIGFVSLLAMVSARAAHADAPIGAVAEPNTKDTVAIPASGGTPRDLHFQAAVFKNDTVVTKDLGTALQFTDQTLLHVSSNSSVVLDSFVFDPGTGTLDGTVKLGVGVFRLVSGALVKHDNLQLVTPVTTLTIRGTDLVVAVEKDGTTRLRLYEGSIRIKTCNGTSLWMRPNQRIVVSPSCDPVALTIDNNKDHGTAVAHADSAPGNPPGNPGGPPGNPGGPPGDPGGPPTSHDPGTGNGGPGVGNGGVSHGKGNGGDPGNGHGNNPGN